MFFPAVLLIHLVFFYGAAWSALETPAAETHHLSPITKNLKSTCDAQSRKQKHTLTKRERSKSGFWSLMSHQCYDWFVFGHFEQYRCYLVHKTEKKASVSTADDSSAEQPAVEQAARTDWIMLAVTYA